MALSSVGNLLRPKSFLYAMSLRTGVELITLSILINKITGLYGLLAIFTGFQLSPLQLSMYIYSLFALLTVIILAPHIRKQSAFQNLALAWFYLLDSAVNAAYTAAFGVSWFLVLARHNSPFDDMSDGKTAPGGQMIGDTAGFTNPQQNVSSVEIIPGSPSTGEDTAILTHPGDVPAGTGAFSTTIFESGSVASVTVISALWLIRLYFILVFFAYARMVLRQHLIHLSHNSHGYSTDSNEKYADDPFAVDKEGGRGWKGWLGRKMICFPRFYWLGSDADEVDWMKDMGGKFKKATEPSRPFERERRHRSGTGPPILQPIELDKIRK